MKGNLRFPEQNKLNFKDRGLGDTIDRFTQATGIKWLIVTIADKFGKNCGCKKRRELLNKWFPYKKKQKNKMTKITLEDILDPITPKIFFTEYWNKKHLVIRRNKFKDLFTWKDFDKCLNQYPNLQGLQIINYHEKGDKRWCLDKVKNGKLKLPMLQKNQVYKLWKEGKTFVIPLAEYQKKELLDICNEFERYFQSGTVNIYASPKAGSESFPAHADSTENFLFHTEGKQKWTIYKEFAPIDKDKPEEILEEFVLESGDLLYIPQYQFHKVDTIDARLMLSIHFKNKNKQSLKDFKITQLGDSNRDKWYDWTPPKKQKIIPSGRRMESDNWKKRYFRNKI